MKLGLGRLAISAVACAACSAAVPSTVQTDLSNASRLDGMAYGYQDAATPAAALMRGAYCANAAAMRDLNLAIPDAGIVCMPP